MGCWKWLKTWENISVEGLNTGARVSGIYIFSWCHAHLAPVGGSRSSVWALFGQVSNQHRCGRFSQSGL